MISIETFCAELGPGLITGAADDDPSAIATYSVTGATFGYGPLWTALFSWPLLSLLDRTGAVLDLAGRRRTRGT